MKKISILTAVLLGLGTAGVLAQENNDGPEGRGPRPGGPGQGRPNPEELLKRLDKNGDGKISKEEAPERMAQNFDKLDKNSDGYITQDELRPPGGQGGPGGGRPNPEEMFKRLDKNGDGKISKEEAPERMAENFDKIDQNGDGYITVDEIRPPRGPGGPDQGRPNPEERLKRLDKNGDGKISKEEAPERMAQNFDKIDQNGDGYITVDEIRPPRGPGGPDQGRPNPEERLKRLDKNGDGKISKEEAPERMAENFDKLDKNSDGYLTADELTRPGGPRGPRPDGEPRE